MDSAPDHESFMKLAILAAKMGVRNGQAPFGACIVRGNEVVVVEHNVVWETKDITAHAEVTAIRRACVALDTVDLSGCRIYSTCEPCPMCFSACHWARISEIYFGASIDDAAECGFNELRISNRHLNRHLKLMGETPKIIVSGLMREENLKLFRMWQKRQDRKAY